MKESQKHRNVEAFEELLDECFREGREDLLLEYIKRFENSRSVKSPKHFFKKMKNTIPYVCFSLIFLLIVLMIFPGGAFYLVNSMKALVILSVFAIVVCYFILRSLGNFVELLVWCVWIVSSLVLISVGNVFSNSASLFIGFIGSLLLLSATIGTTGYLLKTTWESMYANHLFYEKYRT